MNNPSYSSLVAKFYDRFLEDNVDDINFIKSYTNKRNNKSILELAVGTGRQLIPLLINGYNVDGLDNSNEMLEIAKNKINSLKLKSTLFNENMADFKLPNKYDFIFIGCGSFMIVDYDNGKKTLNCIKEHLTENGELLIDLFIPWDDIKKSQNNNMEIVRDVSSNNERCLVYESFEVNIHEQRKYGKYKYEHYVDNKLLTTEINELNIRWYYEDEIVNILKEIGFSKVEILGNYSGYIKNESFIISAKK